MILEHALLQVRPGQSDAFEAAMAEARPIIARQAGCHSVEVRPEQGNPDRYLLLVTWDRIESHRDGFRGSEDYQRWRALLHAFYDPMPEITYYGPGIFHD
ncbi:antibiotic biosynthesis monooxygenase family protein [Sphingorhabdus sp. YGSMI21]|uniref:antibiotic biosynthesis monooxygenase family protein n=1 Tax=Sphingorhabdus sp. YGSMI21 TaxID=2077182 RepID=UPI000C1E315F|nr:antibiotic biosynthesis monooxygenase family protein [Sphingorhabdus sp. YGSMI21]ATW03010.1 antibiotic biosynthesis monooxygenase [Sphingorhabdus sp. YGSMI21]